MEETLLATKERKKRQKKRREETYLQQKWGFKTTPQHTHTHTQVPYFVIN
jgi:hypothetical protein